MSGYLDAYLRQRDEYSTQGFMTGARPRSGSADASIARLRSGFGAQVSSTKPSSPGIGFGTAGRDASLKQYLSRQHARVTAGNNSMGPCYKTYPESVMARAGAATFGGAQRMPRYDRWSLLGPGQYKVPGGVGEQLESGRGTSPRATFGSCTRDARAKVYLDARLMRAYCSKESPPPGAYNIPGRSAPGVAIGTGNRPPLDSRIVSGRAQPGPGQYSTVPGVGRQALSARRSPPAYGFGTGTREALTSKAFISRAHGMAAHSTASPGPATAAPYQGTGRPQLLSTRRSSPGWGFGRAQRLNSRASDTPGVGSYYA